MIVAVKESETLQQRGKSLKYKVWQLSHPKNITRRISQLRLQVYQALFRRAASLSSTKANEYAIQNETQDNNDEDIARATRRSASMHVKWQRVKGKNEAATTTMIGRGAVSNAASRLMLMMTMKLRVLLLC